MRRLVIGVCDQDVIEIPFGQPLAVQSKKTNNKCRFPGWDKVF